MEKSLHQMVLQPSIFNSTTQKQVFSCLVGTPQRNQFMCFPMASVLKKYLLEVIKGKVLYMGKFMCRKIKTQNQKFNPHSFSLTPSLQYSFLKFF